MWVLNNLQSGKLFYLKPEAEKFLVGRHGDLQLTNDDSISRNHCEILVKNGVVYLKDNGSRYGTYLNENIENLQKMPPNQEFLLEENSRVLFGRFNNIWSLSKFSFKILISNVQPDTKKEKLKQMFRKLHFETLDTFDKDCTHLTMPVKAITTLKLLHALVACVPVVTPNFWVAVYKCINENEAIPDYKEYLPKISESYLQLAENALEINEVRKKLFHKKTFVFMHESQMADYQEIISLAGGNCVSAHKSKIAKKSLLQDSYICIQRRQENSRTSNTQKIVEDLSSYLTNNGSRMIPESEIGSAILHCSLENFCNPKKKFDKNFQPNSALIKIQKSKVLVAESDKNKSLAGVSMLEETIDNEPQEINSASRYVEACVVEGSKELVMATEDVDGEGEVVDGPKSHIEIPETQENQVIVSIPETQSQSQNGDKEDLICSYKRKAPAPDVNEPSTSKVRKVNQTPQNKRKASPIPPHSKPKQFRSDIIDLDSSHEEEPPAPKAPEPSKRKPVKKRSFESDDDDDDDLFKFNNNLAKKFKIYEAPPDSGKDVTTDIPVRTINTETSQNTSQDSQSSRPIPRKPLSVTKTINVTPITTSNSFGWLTKEFRKLKTEDDSNSEQPKIKQEFDENSMAQQISKAFQVKYVDIEIKPKTSLYSSTEDFTDSMTNGRKNFKKFIKKRNYKEQTVVLPTTRFDSRSVVHKAHF